VLIPEGTYAALAFGSEIGQRAGFAFTPEYFLRLPTEFLFFAGSESNFFAVPAQTFRIWLFEPIALKEIGWIYVALASLIILSRRRNSASILAFAVAPAIALLIPGLVSDRLYEINIAKFTVLGISLGGLAVGVAAAELLARRKAGLARVGAGVLAGGLIVFASATWMLAVPLWPARLSEQPYRYLKEELEATDYLRSLDYGRRALILPGPTDKEEVNSDGWEGMHRFVVSFGATAIPMGLDRWGAAHLYQPYYIPAYDSLDEAAMAQLRIDTIYVAPHLLNEEQERMLESAVAEGRAKLLFESFAGNRQIYEYQPR
jgi:pimeloyl-ACP methyl ester carboxylesterase